MAPAKPNPPRFRPPASLSRRSLGAGAVPNQIPVAHQVARASILWPAGEAVKPVAAIVAGQDVPRASVGSHPCAHSGVAVALGDFDGVLAILEESHRLTLCGHKRAVGGHRWRGHQCGAGNNRFEHHSFKIGRPDAAGKVG